MKRKGPGRPPIDPDGILREVRVKVTQVMDHDLAAAEQRTGRNRSELTRDAIDAYLPRILESA